MSDPRYVQRDKDGNVVGHFANPQPYAQEQVAADHPDILAWYARIAAAKTAYMEQKAALDPQAMMDRIVALESEVVRLKSPL